MDAFLFYSRNIRTSLCLQNTKPLPGVLHEGYFTVLPFLPENFTLGKPSNFSAASDPTSDPGFLVVDGNRSHQGDDVVNTTCMFSPPGFKAVDWTVDLQLNYSISGLLLVFRDTGWQVH